MGKGRTFTLLPQFDRVVETLLNSPWLMSWIHVMPRSRHFLKDMHVW